MIKISIKFLSLIVELDSARSHLKQAAEHLKKDEADKSVVGTTIAFRELVKDYEEHLSTTHGVSSFSFKPRNVFLDSRGMGLQSGSGPLLARPDFQRKLAEYIEWVNESLDDIQTVVRILAMGIDYPRYVRFRRLIPQVYSTIEGEYDFQFSKYQSSISTDQAQFWIDFVIETAFKIQQSMYSLPLPP